MKQLPTLSRVMVTEISIDCMLLFQIFIFYRYFKHKTFYGLSCYERISVDNAEERGARMKSVGVICTKYTSLHEHMEFLEKQVR